MNVSIARTLAEASRHPAQVIRRGAEDSTHLIYIDDWQQFVAMKIYRREFFADGGVVRQFLERVEGVQAAYASGIAYPFAGGHENGRLYLLLQQLPGHRLTDLVQQCGPLRPSSLIAIGGLIANRLDFVHRHYDLAPSLKPEDVYIHREGPHEWTAGFSDYDLRPVRQPWAYSRESKAVRDLTLLLSYLQTASVCASFDDLLLEPLPALEGPEAERVSRLFRRLLSPNEAARPQTIAEFLRLLGDVTPGAGAEPDLLQPSVSRSLLHWVPEPSALTDRFHYGHPLASLEFPASFEAWDVLEDHACRVHVLPPPKPEHANLSALVQQCVKLAHRNDAGDFTSVDSVMSDPSCCLVSELPPEDLNLWEILKRRERVDLAEAVNVLRLLAETVDRLSGQGFRLPVLQPQNILLRPVDPNAGPGWWEELSPAAALRLTIRPFPTNFLFTEAPALSEIAGSRSARARATRNYFHPRHAPAALAHRVVCCTLRPGEEMAAPLATVFQAAFALPESLPLSVLVARLEKAEKSVHRVKSEAEEGIRQAPYDVRRPAFSFAGLRISLPAYSKPKTA